MHVILSINARTGSDSYHEMTPLLYRGACLLYMHDRMLFSVTLLPSNNPLLSARLPLTTRGSEPTLSCRSSRLPGYFLLCSLYKYTYKPLCYSDFLHSCFPNAPFRFCSFVLRARGERRKTVRVDPARFGGLDAFMAVTQRPRSQRRATIARGGSSPPKIYRYRYRGDSLHRSSSPNER